MGVMFALAGSLMARSLDRPAPAVVRARLRRLLPPMWAFAAVVVPVMFVLGWKPLKEEGIWWFIKLGCYLLPVGAPPYPWESGSPGGFLEESWADQAVGPLWYIRAYLWFVLASPLLLRAFRRLPWATLLAPLGLTAVIGTGLVTVPGETGEGLVDFAVFGSCWVLGFAHHDGLLKKIPRYLTVSLAAFLMAFGLWWAVGASDAGGLEPRRDPAGPGGLVARLLRDPAPVRTVLAAAPRQAGPVGQPDHPRQQPRGDDLPLAQPADHGDLAAHRPAVEHPLGR